MNSSRGISDITRSTRSSVTPCGASCSATIFCAGVVIEDPRCGEYNPRRLIGVVRPALRPTKMAPPRPAALAPGQTYRPRSLTRGICAPLRAGIRALPRLLPDPLGVRAHVVPDRMGRHARVGDVHARLLPSGARPVHRADDDEAVARHAEKPQGPAAS